MFDVSWTDPSQETVGQRKSRKDQQSNEISRGSSIRSSESSGSRASKASSHSKPSLLGFFSTNKKAPLARSGSQTRGSALSPDQKTKASRRISSYVPSEPSSSQKSPTTRVPENEDFKQGNLYNAETDVSSPSDESVLSGSARRSVNTDSSWSAITDPASAKGSNVQPVSRTSFVTQSTEVTVSSQDSVNAGEQLATVVHISAAGTIPIEIHDTQSTVSPKSETFEFPVPTSQLQDKSPVLRDDISLNAEGWSVATKGRQQYTWKPPDTWKCPPEAAVLPTSPTNAPDSPSRRHKNKKATSSSTELTQLRKILRRMDAASPKTFVERLKEEWIEVADASVYRELELEKQLWMLSALVILGKKHSVPEQKDAEGDRPLSNRPKVLSLYENQASASFLAARSSTSSTIHHLSSNPLSPTAYPNVHPLTAPSPSATLPYASNLFTSIHSLYLPALLPAASLPSILKNCHHCLAPAGTLHLTILDPNPLPGTLGPRLRSWLDTHLLTNLERQFRCINPARLFPIWLADAGLRGRGSTISIERFLASVAPPQPTGDELVSTKQGKRKEDGEGKREREHAKGKSDEEKREEEKRRRKKKRREEDETRQQLKTQVGRMLWKEMWGGFVEGEKWWWEDEVVVEECERLKTGWEYAVIAAVKEG